MKRFFISLIAAFSMIIMPAVVSAADPASKDEVCQGIGVVSTTGSCNDGGAVTKVIGKGVEILSYIVGIAAIVVIIISGLTLVTANGDSGALAKAKNTILYAIIGIFLAISANVIVGYVVSEADGKSSGDNPGSQPSVTNPSDGQTSGR